MEKDTKNIAMIAGVFAIVAAVYLFSKKDSAPKKNDGFLPSVTPHPENSPDVRPNAADTSVPKGGGAMMVGEVSPGNNYAVAVPFEAIGLTTGLYRTFQVGEKISVIGKIGTVTTFSDPTTLPNLYTTAVNIVASFIGIS